MKETVSIFLSKNNISFNKEELNTQLLTHPHYPSINSITDLLNHLEIKNLAIELPENADIIKQLPKFFLAVIKSNNKENLLLVENTNNDLVIFLNGKIKVKYTLEKFLSDWTGVVIVVENTEEVSKKIKLKTTNLKLIIPSLLITISLIYLFLNKIPLLKDLVFIFISCLGIFTSLLLLQKELGLSSKNINKFCEDSEGNSCDDVLNSRGAKLFNCISLSDLSFIYFSGILLFFSLHLFVNLKVPKNLIFYTSLSSTLILPYSIYYQWRIVKKWCPLCLITALILFLQFLFVFLNFPYTLPNLIDVFKLICALSILAFFVFSIKSILEKNIELNKIMFKYTKFKRDTSIFYHLLKGTSPIQNNLNDYQDISFGNKNSKLKIILITNPTCYFCREVHKIMEKIIKDKANDIELIIRFNPNFISSNEDNFSLRISNTIINIYNNENTNTAFMALNEIYSGINPLIWLRKWEKDKRINNEKRLKADKDWCTKNGLNFTPILLINGYIFPKQYEKKDLLFFVNDLIDYYN